MNFLFFMGSIIVYLKYIILSRVLATVTTTVTLTVILSSWSLYGSCIGLVFLFGFSLLNFANPCMLWWWNWSCFNFDFVALTLEHQVSDGDGYLERTFMSPAALRAGNLIREWMEDAGLRTSASIHLCIQNVFQEFLSHVFLDFQMGWLLGECTRSSWGKEC